MVELEYVGERALRLRWGLSQGTRPRASERTASSRNPQSQGGEGASLQGHQVPRGPTMRFRFIKERRGAFPIARSCEGINAIAGGELEVPSRPAASRRRMDRVVLAHIKDHALLRLGGHAKLETHRRRLKAGIPEAPFQPVAQIREIFLSEASLDVFMPAGCVADETDDAPRCCRSASHVAPLGLAPGGRCHNATHVKAASVSESGKTRIEADMRGPNRRKPWAIHVWSVTTAIRSKS